MNMENGEENKNNITENSVTENPAGAPNEAAGGQPENPEAGSQPENPAVESQPENPEAGSQSENPEAESQPENPEAGSRPENPEAESQPEPSGAATRQEETFSPGSTQRFDEQTGEPIVTDSAGNTSHGKKKSKIIAALAAVAVILVIIVVTVVNANPKVTLVKALTNTLKDSQSKITDVSVLSTKDDFTVKSSFANNGGGNVDINWDMAICRKGAELSADGKMNLGAGYEISVPFTFYANDKQVAFQSDLLDEKPFYYVYTQTNTGALMGYLEEQNITQEQLNDVLSSLFDGKNPDFTETLKEFGNSLEVKKIDAGEYEVNGGKVKCKGYEISVTGDSLYEVGEQLYEDADIDGKLTALYPNGYDSLLEAMDLSKDDFTDLTLDFYVHGKYIAAVVMTGQADGKDEKIEVDVKGGDYPMQNLAVVTSDSTMEVTGKTGDSGAYEGTISADGEDVMNYTYDPKSGAYTIGVPQTSGNLSGTFLGTDKQFSFSMDTSSCDFESIAGAANLSEDVQNVLAVFDNCQLSYDIIPGSEIKSIDTTDGYDLGNMSMSELQTVGQSIYSNLSAIGQ